MGLHGRLLGVQDYRMFVGRSHGLASAAAHTLTGVAFTVQRGCSHGSGLRALWRQWTHIWVTGAAAPAFANCIMHCRLS